MVLCSAVAMVFCQSRYTFRLFHLVTVIFFIEFRHLEIDESQLVVEHFLSLPVRQLYLVVVVCVMLVVEGEVEDAYDVDRFELVVPAPFLPLFLYGKRGIV